MEVWLVDNASIDGSVAAVRDVYPGVNIIQNQKNVGFAAANNQAFSKMHGRYALLLNTDTVLTERAVEIIYNFMEHHPDVGMACGQLLNKDGSLQNERRLPSVLRDFIKGEERRTIHHDNSVIFVFFPKRQRPPSSPTSQCI